MPLLSKIASITCNSVLHKFKHTVSCSSVMLHTPMHSNIHLLADNKLKCYYIRSNTVNVSTEECCIMVRPAGSTLDLLVYLD